MISREQLGFDALLESHPVPLSSPFDAIRARHTSIYAIVSPPRCGSTAFARVFWEHPTVRYYCHEPFEVTYYRNQGLDEVAAKLNAPLDLAKINGNLDQPENGGLVIKEMPYQVGSNFPLLAQLADKPLIFLIRDPRLNISSRIEKKLEVGDSPFFPLIETGWVLIAKQIEYCRKYKIPYLVVEASDLRNKPLAVLPQVFSQFNLEFAPDMISWPAYQDVELDNLDGAHSHLYRRVLTSTGIQPATEQLPPIDSFPQAHGLRQHVAEALEIYQQLTQDMRRVIPAEQ